ncbi:MAG: M1 family metallopeptidase, partial [Bacteroidota bacterium]
MKRTTLQLLTSFLAVVLLFPFSVFAQNNPGSNHGNKFEQLGQKLRDPNGSRLADGSPGPDYWQQRADYDIECELDEENLRLNGTEKITYYNQSPNPLRYIWMQLDENEHDPHNFDNSDDPSSIRPQMSERSLENLDITDALAEGDYGHKIHEVTDENGDPLKYTINQTMMRVEVPEPIQAGEEFVFNVKWHYNISDRMGPAGGRGGYEYFEDDGNYLFTMTQWFPRLCVYSDFEGWQNKQFTGRGEFALNFGNYVVKMTVPSDHMVGSTGECLNYSTVLSDTQMERWKKAQTAKEPIEIVTLAEAKKNEKKKKAKDTKTWIFKADNVRDFAWTSSRKFVWDAMPHFNEDGKKVMCMSYYAKEAYPIYSKYSTKTVAHTLKTYSNYTFPYPYPVAISVEAANGMEYPMICFNPGRAEEDGTYTERAKMAALVVIVHEVGHNYFPMIVNSDERQWTWMDEGINSFMEFVTLQEFDTNFKHWGGTTDLITGYMRSSKNRLEPIMTNSENIVNFGANAYDKPATGLNMLRETIMGRELFDYAFKEYARRW